MILEVEFKRSIPGEIKLYLDEREVNTLIRAATLADNYSLTHHNQSYQGPGRKYTTVSDQGDRLTNEQNSQSSKSFQGRGSGKESSGKTPKPGKASSPQGHPNIKYRYCKQRVHIISQCPKLLSKTKAQKESSLLVSSLEDRDPTLVKGTPIKESHSDSFEPFIPEGLVSFTENSHVSYSVRILRDTGASHSVIVKESIPFIEDSYTGQNVLLQGMCGTVNLPLCVLSMSLLGFKNLYLWRGLHFYLGIILLEIK